MDAILFEMRRLTREMAGQVARAPIGRRPPDWRARDIAGSSRTHPDCGGPYEPGHTKHSGEWMKFTTSRGHIVVVSTQLYVSTKHRQISQNVLPRTHMTIILNNSVEIMIHKKKSPYLCITSTRLSKVTEFRNYVHIITRFFSQHSIEKTHKIFVDCSNS